MPQSYKIFFKSKVKSLYFSFISKHKITKILSISKHKNRQKAEHFQQTAYAWFTKMLSSLLTSIVPGLDKTILLKYLSTVMFPITV